MTIAFATELAARFQRGFNFRGMREAPLRLVRRPDTYNPDWLFEIETEPAADRTRIYVSESRRRVWAPGWDAGTSF